MGREPPSRENVVMTSPYKQAFVLAGSGEGKGSEKMHQLISKKNQTCFVYYAKLNYKIGKSSGKS